MLINTKGNKKVYTFELLVDKHIYTKQSIIRNISRQYLYALIVPFQAATHQWS